MRELTSAKVMYGKYKYKSVQIREYNHQNKKFKIVEEPYYIRPDHLLISRDDMLDIIRANVFEYLFMDYEVNQDQGSYPIKFSAIYYSFNTKG